MKNSIIYLLVITLVPLAGSAQVFELQTDRNPSMALIDDVEDGLGIAIPRNDKWIGIMCRPVDASLRAHISLPDNTGLLVEEVIPDSPAEESGLQKYDILLSAGGAPLSTIGDLIHSIRDAGDSSLLLEWVRGGEVTEIEITPTDRPSRPSIAFGKVNRDDPNVNSLRAWFDELENNGFHGQQPLKLRVFGEGFDVVGEDYPADLSVQVEKSGNELAQITVRRGNSSWEVTEDRIDELPEDVQPFVQRFLGGGTGQIMDFHFNRRMNGQMPFLHLDQSIQEMHQRMDEMLEQLRELKEREPDGDDDEDTIDA